MTAGSFSYFCVRHTVDVCDRILKGELSERVDKKKRERNKIQ